MTEFDAAMALTQTDEAGVFTGRLDHVWTIGPAVNGGVLMGLAAQALSQVLGSGEMPHADPYALSAHFLSAGEHGDVTVATEVIRRGRSISTGQASLRQLGRDGAPVERMRALATYGDLASAEQVHRTLEPPSMPGPEECVSSSSMRSGGPIEAPPLMHRLDLRLDPSTAGWAVGKPSGRGEMLAWIRFADGREADPISLLFFLDAMPPVSFDLGIPGWAPTLEFSGHVRGRPAPGWLQMRTTSSILSGSLMEEEAVIWDLTGRVVAQSRQLCRVRLPEGWSAPGA
ncbi:MAG: thioesterase family protein [Mobilicoccus sp.]|nr:thioesterase family protein [Mobilicoccus sp.]